MASTPEAASAPAVPNTPEAASALAKTSPPTPPAALSAPPACVVPTAAEGPPQQKPASVCPKETGSEPNWSHGHLRFPDAKGAPRLSVEIARTPDAHEHGLMFRKKMPEDQGMLFEWGFESRRIFWMHNTCIPLDMLFVAKDGTIAGILEQVPVLNDAPRAVPCPAAYVLEVNAGWCRRHGVKAGMHMSLD